MPLAVATSTRHQLALDKLGRAGILDYFTLVVYDAGMRLLINHP